MDGIDIIKVTKDRVKYKVLWDDEWIESIQDDSKSAFKLAYPELSLRHGFQRLTRVYNRSL